VAGSEALTAISKVKTSRSQIFRPEIPIKDNFVLYLFTFVFLQQTLPGNK
jgi:hypothetical protein